MAFIIGLGGSGVRFVRTLIEQQKMHFEGALTIDVIEHEEARNSVTPSEQLSKWKHLCLVDENSTIESVVRSGIDASYNSDDSQLALKQLASWRASFKQLPLLAASGRFRSIGRAISIASKLNLQSEIRQIKALEICIVTSADGGTGSALLVDVLKIVDELDRKVNVVVVALNSIVLRGSTDVGFCANSVATLCELENYFSKYLGLRNQEFQRLNLRDERDQHYFQFSKFFGTRNLLIVNRQDSDQIQFAIETLPERIHENLLKESYLVTEISVAQKNLALDKNTKMESSQYRENMIQIERLARHYLSSQERQISEELENALKISAQRFLDRLQPVKSNPALFRSNWAYCRSRILTEFVEPGIVTKCIRGWLTALCLNRIQIDNNQVQITDNTGRIHQFLILRPIDADGIDALPSVIEAAPIALRSDPRSSYFGYGAITALMQYAEADPHLVLGEQPKYTTEAVSTFQKEFRNFVGLGAPLKLDTPIALGESETARASLINQKNLSLHLVQMSYHGDEAVDTDGRITPPETFFRDIVEEYLAEIDRLLTPPSNPHLNLQKETSANNNSRKQKSQKADRRISSKKRALSSRLATTNAKPYAWIRYGGPILLGAVSIAIYFGTLDDQGKQQSWANSATIVSGFMAGFAVCLGAIALISSIQNSSIRIQRTDRLYEACLGVQEAITFFELGKEAALATNERSSDPKDLWNDPSLHLASMMLGLKLKVAMDTGLYRLLAYADQKKGVTGGTINSASALQAFSLLDGLVRIAPEIVYEKERPRSELISTPDQILETARKLNENLSQITYKMVSKSLEFTPSTNL